MQIEHQVFFDFNNQMFSDVSISHELHEVESPELQNKIFETIQDSEFDLSIDKDDNDDSKSEICEETLQNTGFRKIPEEFVQSPISTRSLKNNRRHPKKKPTSTTSRPKIITKGKQGSKKDYKKNICGYMTRRVLKQSLSQEYHQNIEHLCKKLKVPTFYFYKIYRAHNSQNITGPTHFYNLVNPRLVKNDLEESRREISVRMVFLTFFEWFLRSRYIRYLMGDGKMAQKDKYVYFKNREMMFLIASERKEMLQRAQDALKEGFQRVESTVKNSDEIYSEMAEINRMEMSDEKEQKREQESERERVKQQIEQQKQGERIREGDNQIGDEFQSMRM